MRQSSPRSRILRATPGVSGQDPDCRACHGCCLAGLRTVAYGGCDSPKVPDTAATGAGGCPEFRRAPDILVPSDG